ncbi:MAG: hypothetical protein IKS67_03165 [Victivallales bacterium]|nr:hypothetical protein [Victivallales bacterium]
MAEHFDNHDILSQNTTQDNVIKMLFTHKQIVAIMLRECLPEFNGVPLNFITEKCLDGLEDADYLIGDKTHGNAGIDMDICIHARLPKDLDSQVGVIINIEVQQNFHPGYDIIKRGIYYGCSLIAMEKETVFADSDYDNLKKVYSIWICLDVPLDKANTIIRYGMAELCPTDVTHGVHRIGAPYDLLEVMMVCLNDKCENGGDVVIDMLRTLLSQRLSKEEKQKLLKEKYSITFTQEKQMKFNYYEYVKETNLKIGEEKGFQLGEIQTRKTVVTNMLLQGKSEKDIQATLGLNASQVRELIRDVQSNAQA